MNKDEAKKRLSSIEVEVKELRKIIEAPELITDRVKTFQDACDVLNISSRSIFSEEDTKDEIAYKKLKIIARALNEGWTPDWENSSQYKYYPWFRIKSGFAFSDSHYGYSHSHSDVCSRLCFSSEKLAEYAGKQFENIYKDFLI